MDRFLSIVDELHQVEISLKKFSKFKPETKKAKTNKLLAFKQECKEILEHKELSEEVRSILITKYKNIRETVHHCIKILKGKNPESEEYIEEQEVVEEEESGSVESLDSDSEGESSTMATLDLSLALKIVDKFSGDSLELGHFLETVDLLKAYSQGVAEANILVFLKTRLVGPAHGSIEGATTVDRAKQLLTQKFAVQLTPTACEAELKQARQKQKSITEFGKEVEQLAAKLATAYVSNGTFANESAASAIVQPVATSAFTAGLNNSQTAFFVKARNPQNLNRAISDALEVLPTRGEEVNFYGSPRDWRSSRSRGYNARGRVANYQNFRGTFRGRYNNPNQNNNNNNYQYQRGNGAGRGRRGQDQRQQNNRDDENPNNNNNRRRNANVAEEPQQAQQQQHREEANVGEFFR